MWAATGRRRKFNKIIFLSETGICEAHRILRRASWSLTVRERQATHNNHILGRHGNSLGFLQALAGGEEKLKIIGQSMSV
jgi:hypothetical protein